MARPPGSAGNIESVAPQGALAQELAEVANSATNLRRALAGANVLPDDFPRGDLDAVAGTLESTPAMSVDGALDALTYARPKLSQLRRRWVAIEDSGSDLPDVQRGGAIDQAIARLIADVDTAREWYYEARKAASEASDAGEDALAPAGTDDLSALSARARETAEKAATVADELAEGATPGSVAADNLVRGVRDVEVLSRQESIELSAPRPRLNLLDRLGQAVDRSARYAKGALRVVEAGADFANIAWERFSNVLTRQVSVLLEEVRDGARQLRERIAHYEKEWAKEKEGTRRPSSPLDLAIFRDIDAPWCPEMVVIPGGTFVMDSSPRAGDRQNNERSRHMVTIGYWFALGRNPVTFDGYDHFCAATNREKPKDHGWGRGKRPVINVSWDDAVAYCDWLAKETGNPYRLPSETEWECARQFGRTTSFSFADDTPPKHAVFLEWVADEWRDGFYNLPTDGSAYVTENAGINPSLHVLRSIHGRSSIAQRGHPPDYYYNHGFRVARTLD